MAVGGHHGRVGFGHRGDGLGRARTPGRAADVRIGRRDAARVIGVAPDIDPDRIGHDRHAGVVGRLLGLNDDIDQLGGRRLQVGDALAGHGAGDVEHQPDLDVLRRPVDLGMGADRQGVVQQLAVGRQDNVGDQGLHIDRRIGDHDLVGVQGKGGAGQVDVGIVLQVGVQGLGADRGQIGLGCGARAGGGQGRGVQGVLQVRPHRRGAVDIHPAHGDHHQDRQADGEDHRHIAARGGPEPPGERPRSLLPPPDPVSDAHGLSARPQTGAVARNRGCIP
jgi:hypothetical protein